MCFECSDLILFDNTPNQKKQINFIKSNSKNSCEFLDSELIGLKSFVNLERTRIFLKKKGIHFKRLLELFDCKHIDNLHKISKFNVVNYKYWFCLGLALSPIMHNYKKIGTKLSESKSIKKVFFTGYTGLVSVISDELNKNGIDSYSVLHGSLGFTYAIRSTCNRAVLEYSSDVEFLQKYSFQKEILYKKKLNAYIEGRSIQLEKVKVIGYATNLFAGLGPLCSIVEKKDGSLVSAGEHCNNIVLGFMELTGIKMLTIKCHPREKKESYSLFVESLCNIGIQVEFSDDLDNFLDLESAFYISHPSSVSLDMAYRNKFFAVFFENDKSIDSESTIGVLCALYGFSDLIELAHSFQGQSRSVKDSPFEDLSPLPDSIISNFVDFN